MARSLPRALTIAGSDSGGGAGIQADLKSFAALGCYGMSAITAITAQNTVGVAAIHDVPPDVIRAQIDAVLSDIGADAVKTGMLSRAETIEAVADTLTRHKQPKLVVDPVMVAKSGDALLHDSARDALVTRLLPLALVVTPNIPEAQVLAAIEISGDQEAQEAARRILDLGPKYVLLKGGHLPGPAATDWLFSADGSRAFSAGRIDTKNTHGTGCTYAAAIAAGLAKGLEVMDAVAQAKEYLTGAISHSLPLGHGHGPLDHFWNLCRGN